MKFLAVSILMLLVLLQTFSKYVLMAEYTINKDYIAKNLCENKARPTLHCNGKCQLMKKMAEEEKQNSSNPNSTGKIQIGDILFTHKIQVPSIAHLSKEKEKFNDEFVTTIPSTHLTSIFHPPSAA